MGTDILECRKNQKDVISKSKNLEEKHIEYHILGVSDWDFFDILIAFLKKHYDAEVAIEDDGIFTRSHQLRIRDEYLILKHHEDIGNWFYSCQPEGDSDLMEAIAADLDTRLREVEYD